MASYQRDLGTGVGTGRYTAMYVCIEAGASLLPPASGLRPDLKDAGRAERLALVESLWKTQVKAR